jgi:predicted MPP superfamily phosphohydrolase
MPSRRTRQAVLFFSIVLGYAGMQGYAVLSAYTGLGLAPRSLPLLFAWVGLMTFFPFLLWRLERGGWHRLATAGAWLGYGWMGVVFLFFWIALALDGAGLVAASAGVGAVSGAGSFALALGLTLVVAGYGVFAATRPRIERVALASPKLPAGTRLRIALLSDVHLGALVGRRALRRILRRLATLDADLVLSAGDLVDGQADRLGRLLPLLAELRPRLGKFAVIGNHECYVGLEHALDFHRRAGFTVLRGTAVDIAPGLSLAGVDDPAAGSFHHTARLDERAALAAIAPGRYTLLLKHQPVVAADGEARADLQLSGHVHQGQIFPFNLLVRLVYKARTGLTPLAGGGHLYVSRGTGTWGPPMRVLAPPEITLFELSGTGAGAIV